jgi:hypothetical protein
MSAVTVGNLGCVHVGSYVYFPLPKLIKKEQRIFTNLNTFGQHTGSRVCASNFKQLITPKINYHPMYCKLPLTSQSWQRSMEKILGRNFSKGYMFWLSLIGDNLEEYNF